MKADAECVLYVFVGVFVLSENVLSACLFLKKSFSLKCDFSREMTFYKHGLVYFNTKKNSIFTTETLFLKYHVVSSYMCPLKVGLTETPELRFLLQPVLGLYFKMLIKSSNLFLFSYLLSGKNVIDFFSCFDIH